jgi:hypothetical protein
MHRVGFGPTIPAFEREKTVHALDCVATVKFDITDYIIVFMCIETVSVTT